ncbi:hypothetical protein [Pontibacter liquoris]|uniref:hypothetical protein n=1 Tax=Pontibacter liquoris TaxID=2905677 RepID=UPI001FA77661|nr:hypothetical protein [Pontibacter liquoris]
MLLLLAASACDRGTAAKTDSEGVVSLTAAGSIAAQEQQVQQALHHDARLARTMPLTEFARHMHSRQAYYKKFDEVNYEDDFVKIELAGEVLKIETPEGKAEFHNDKSKIRANNFKRKREYR